MNLARRVACYAVIPCALLTTSLGAQEAGANPAPLSAKALVVRIFAKWNAEFNPEDGAGVIVGFDNGSFHVATARHVVAKETNAHLVPADSIWVSFFPPSSADSTLARLTLLDSAFLARDRDSVAIARASRDAGALRTAAARLETDSALIAQYDLAVLRVSRPASGPLAHLSAAQLDWLGRPEALAFGDPVSPMGCPKGECWSVPVPSDRFIELLPSQPSQVTFQSNFIQPGSSGGALFNQWWEVVGIVIRSDPPRAIAIPMNEVVDVLSRSRIHEDIRAPRFPRDGYHLLSGVTLLSGATAASVDDSVAEGARAPSSRVTLSRRGGSPLAVHAALMRLAPYNLVVNAALGGASYVLQTERFSLEPFFELGISRAQSRYDAGGYYALSSTTGGAAEYVPLWRRQSTAGMGFGGGASAGYLIVPHYRVTVTLAKWSFDLPERASPLPGVFVGGGLRWER